MNPNSEVSAVGHAALRNLDLLTAVKVANVRRPRNSSRHFGDIAAKSVTNLAEDRESQISFTSLDSSEVTSVQSTLLGEAVLAEPPSPAFGLNPAAQPQELYVVVCQI